MNIILVRIILGVLIFVFTFYSLTILKLYDCGVSFDLSVKLGLRIIKLTNTNIKLFFKYKNKSFKLAFKHLIKPLNYKVYLEEIAFSAVELHCKINAVEEIIPDLKNDKRLKLNTLMKKQSLNLEVTKDNKLKTISLNKKKYDYKENNITKNIDNVDVVYVQQSIDIKNELQMA